MRTGLVVITVIAGMLAGCGAEAKLDAPTVSSGPIRTEPSLTPANLSTAGLDSTAVDAIVTNSADGVVLIEVPGGEFMMGAEPESGFAICEQSRGGCALEDFEDESPRHPVYLSDYWIYQTEVTNTQYRLCVEVGWCDSPEFLEFYADPRFGGHPVVYVNWYAAEKYCYWAGGGLPTEAEWEKAARGMEERVFPWGDEADCGFANLKGCTQGLTMPVGSFPGGASIYGVLDMAGNATEWVTDWFDPGYYEVSPMVNPIGPDEGELKVARGGSWKNPFSGIRSTNRTANFPEVAGSGTGFRCVLDEIPVINP